MRLTTPLLTLTIYLTPALSIPPASPSIRNIYTFPNNTFIENIAARSNSALLVTSLSVPHLYTIDPKSAIPTASVVYTFPNASGISGIAEISPDIFALVTGIWDLAATRAALGSLAVWTVDLTRGPTPVVRKVTGIANSTIFNGVARHPTNPRLLLAADSDLGAVWKVDLATGSYGVAFQSALFTPTGTAPGTNLGINGLKAKGLYMYFTNSAQGIYGRYVVDSAGGAVGSVQVISNSSAAGRDVVYDDFALEREGPLGLGSSTAWIASHPDYVVEVKASGAQRVVEDEAVLFNPTAAAFGRGDPREENTVYVTNGGRFVFTDTGFDLVDEGVVAVRTR